MIATIEKVEKYKGVMLRVVVLRGTRLYQRMEASKDCYWYQSREEALIFSGEKDLVQGASWSP